MWLALPLFYLALDQLYLILGRITNDGLMRGKIGVVHMHVSSMLLQCVWELVRAYKLVRSTFQIN
jgi:hypothetical protein